LKLVTAFRFLILALQIADIMKPHAEDTLNVASINLRVQTSSVCAKYVSVQDILSPIVKLEHLLQVNTAMHHASSSSQAHSTEYSQVSRLSYSQSKLERRKGVQTLMQENANPNCIRLSPRRPVKTAKKQMPGEEQADYISASTSSKACATGTRVAATAHEDHVKQQIVDRSVLLRLHCEHLVAMACAGASCYKSNLQTPEVLCVPKPYVSVLAQAVIEATCRLLRCCVCC